MTVLHYVLEEQAVYLLTDTVVSDPATMRPMAFTSKVFSAPHWQGVMTGTGICPFVVEWAFTSMSTILARDFVHLDEYAPKALRRLYPKYQKMAGPAATSTVYHFGFNEDEGRFVGFAYRSANKFVSERLPYAIGLKPDPEYGPEEAVELNAFPADFISVAQRQKTRDEAKPINERVGVGGKLIAYYLNRFEDQDGALRVRTSMHECYDFPDYGRAYALACDALPSNAV